MLYQLHNLEIHAAHSCNLRCQNCSHFSDYGLSGILSLENAEMWFEGWSKRLRPTHFSVLGGEPLLNPNIIPLLKLVKKYWVGSEIKLVTNGLLLPKHPTLLQTLYENDITLDISLHDSNTTIPLPISSPIKINLRKSYEKWRLDPPSPGHNPIISYTKCVCRFCTQLHNNMIWKCPRVAYVGFTNLSYWSDYKPLLLSASDEEVEEFLNRKEESICGICP